LPNDPACHHEPRSGIVRDGPNPQFAQTFAIFASSCRLTFVGGLEFVVEVDAAAANGTPQRHSDPKIGAKRPSLLFGQDWALAIGERQLRHWLDCDHRSARPSDGSCSGKTNPVSMWRIHPTQKNI